jgi:hypothetical protein
MRTRRCHGSTCGCTKRRFGLVPLRPRTPDSVATARLCRVAHEAGRDDLADVFAAALPGVGEGVLIPVWRLPNAYQVEAATFEETMAGGSI